jgi:hypothetical protein
VSRDVGYPPRSPPPPGFGTYDDFYGPPVYPPDTRDYERPAYRAPVPVEPYGGYRDFRDDRDVMRAPPPRSYSPPGGRPRGMPSRGRY